MKANLTKLVSGVLLAGGLMVSGLVFAEDAGSVLEAPTASTGIEKPSVFMSKIVNDVVSKLNSGEVEKNNAAEAQQYIVTLLEQYVDIPFMAKYIVGPQLFDSASSTDQSAFDDALTRWVANLYYGAFKLYDPETTKISIYPVRVNYQTAQSVLVHSIIKQSHSSQITVDYRCKQDDGE